MDDKIVKLEPREDRKEVMEIKPTWEATLFMWVHVIETGKPEAKKEALREILKAGRLLDKLIKERTEDHT